LSECLGGLALIAAVALISPGVHAVRADDSPVPEKGAVTGDGEVCEGGLPAHADVVIVNHLQQMQRLHVQSLAASGRIAKPDVEVVDINSRGSNYPTR
jgi:hypothetical protein